MNFLKKTVFVCSLFVFAGFAHAQTLPVPSSVDGIDIAANPTTPAPGTPVAVQLISYVTNLSGADITWYVNGKTALKGTGQTILNITAPTNGKKTAVIAAIHTVEGRDVEKNIIIAPNDVDLVWETNGYLPPFFKGKIGNTYQNTVTVIAVPHFIGSNGNEIDPRKLIYTWKKDSDVLGNLSGYGRQSVQVTGDIVPRPYTVHVDINSADGAYHASADLSFDISKQFLVFYPEDPLYGVFYNTAIGDKFHLSQNEVSVVVAPFGFNTNESTAMNYVWSVNDTEQPTLANKKEVLFRVKDGSTGTSNITLNIQNNGSILQEADGGFGLYFKAKSSGSATTIFQ